MALYISDANGQLKKVAGNQRVVDLQDVYPVGSIYMSINSTSPAGLFGGSWTQIPANYALWTATSGAGNTISAGLPNIKGTWETRWNQAVRGFHEATASGAFYIKTDTSKPGRVTSEDGNANNSSHNGYPWFNASNYNPIYSDSVSTVQPPAYKVYAWRRTA